MRRSPSGLPAFAHQFTIPVVMSGHSPHDLETRFAHIRADALLGKPFQFEGLASAVQRAIHQAESPRSVGDVSED
jgi:FixJ family two-component response regulator